MIVIVFVGYAACAKEAGAAASRLVPTAAASASAMARRCLDFSR
jgi:hypothetical protein